MSELADNVVEFVGSIKRPNSNKLMRRLIAVVDESLEEGDITYAELFGTIHILNTYLTQRFIGDMDDG